MSTNVTKDAVKQSIIKQKLADEINAAMKAAQALACVSTKVRNGTPFDKAVYDCVKEARD